MVDLQGEKLEKSQIKVENIQENTENSRDYSVRNVELLEDIMFRCSRNKLRYSEI